MSAVEAKTGKPGSQLGRCIGLGFVKEATTWKIWHGQRLRKTSRLAY
jgi:hypothetical protein